MCCGATKPIQPQQMSLCTMTRERPHCKEDPVQPNMFLNNLKNKKEAVCLMSLIFTHLPSQKEAWTYKPGTLSIETLWDLRTFVIAFSFNNKCFSSWMNWAIKFCLIHLIHLTSHQPPLLEASKQLFAGKMLLQPAGGRKCFLRVCQIPKHRFLCYKNKPTYFSLEKMCWL